MITDPCWACLLTPDVLEITLCLQTGGSCFCLHTGAELILSSEATPGTPQKLPSSGVCSVPGLALLHGPASRQASRSTQEPPGHKGRARSKGQSRRDRPTSAVNRERDQQTTLRQQIPKTNIIIEKSPLATQNHIACSLKKNNIGTLLGFITT